MCFKKKLEWGGKELNYATFLLQPKCLCLQWPPSKLQPPGTGPFPSWFCLLQSLPKKVYLNHYYFHTFCSKLKTDSKYEPGDFIRHAVFIKGKSHTRPLALASLLQMLVFAVVLICRG